MWRQMEQVADKIERWCGHPIFFLIFNALFVVGNLLLGVDATNICISLFTADIMILMLSAQRRGQKATHAKLDVLLKKNPDAPDNFMRAEDKTEQEIEELREAIEEHTEAIEEQTEECKGADRT